MTLSLQMNTPRYLLLCPRYCDPMALSGPDQIDAAQGLYAISQPHVQLPAHWALRLVDLQQRPDIAAQAVQWLEDTRTFARDLFGGWLTTDASPVVIITHIEQHMVQRRPDGQRMLLRFFDPRVMDQLACLLDDAQRQVLMGPITHWTLPDADRRLLTIERPDLPRTRLSPAATLIRTEQWQAIELTERVERIRRCWQNVLQGHPLPSDHYQRILTWMSLANAHGLSDETDVTTFILLGIEQGWRYDKTPAFQRLLRQHRGTDTPLTALIAQMTTQEWSHLTQTHHRDPVSYGHSHTYLP